MQAIRIPTGGHLPSRSESLPPGFFTSTLYTAGVAIHKEAATHPPALLRVVLIFRDGHREEIEMDVIQNDVIYAGSDYWSNGSWTQKIPIIHLDVQATLKLNQQPNGKVSLPFQPR